MGGLSRFNALAAADAEGELLACCAAPGWASQVATGRPYRDVGALLDAAGAALDRLDWPQVEAALAAHPRIGERPAGASREATWSRREQSGAAGPDPTTRAALAEANRAYEQRFGRTFLIFASGRSGTEMLAVARERLGNDEVTERRIVREELAKIARARLTELVT
jgi:2-oxo-4-hydroxy-4-carboxy-5-ureidoimidazoline decarboxylase